MNSLLPKFDEVRYIANINNASIIGISESKLDQTFLSSELEANGYDLISLVDDGEVVVLLVTLNIEYLLFDICLPKSKPNLLDILNRPQT